MAASSIFLDLFGSPAINCNFLVVLPSGMSSYLRGIFAQPQLISRVRLPSTTAITNSNKSTYFSNFLGSYPPILMIKDRTSLPNVQTSSTSWSHSASTCQTANFIASPERSNTETFRYLFAIFPLISGRWGMGTPDSYLRSSYTKISLFVIYPPSTLYSLLPIFLISLMKRP